MLHFNFSFLIVLYYISSSYFIYFSLLFFLHLSNSIFFCYSFSIFGLSLLGAWAVSRVGVSHKSVIINFYNMFRFLLLICVLVGSGFGCSCEPGSFARSRESVICDDFGDSANVFLATAQEAYCKCLPTEDDNQQFSCIKYNTGEDGFSNGETQETFSCGTNGERATFYYLECDAVTEEVGACT